MEWICPCSNSPAHHPSSLACLITSHEQVIPGHISAWHSGIPIEVHLSSQVLEGRLWLAYTPFGDSSVSTGNGNCEWPSLDSSQDAYGTSSDGPRSKHKERKSLKEPTL